MRGSDRMIKWRSSLSLILVGALLGPLAYAEEQSVQDWLISKLDTGKHSSFSGHSVLLSGGQLVSLKVFHAPVDGEVWERVVHMSGEPAEIIRKGSAVFCLHPQQSTGVAMKSPMRRWSALDEGMRSVSRYYKFERSGVERVAGREAVRLNLSPMDAHRYGYSLWVDTQSGVLLRSQTLPASGDPLEVFEFVSINLGQPLTAEDFEPGQGLNRSVGASPLPGVDNEPPAQHWVPEWLPEGFVESQRVARFQGQGQVTTRAYTDGLASFTVFHEPRPKPINENTSMRGATVAVHRNLPGAMVTVVGEIPLETAERIAASVKPLADAH
ncbi:MAG: hypothetical protein CMK89_04535 [Pseudomonadales bacterium]|nr:hypothetical protein [Pseudomonadales bacterium]